MSPSSDPHFMSRSVPQVSFRLTSSPQQPEILTRPRLICAYEVSYTMRRSSLCHTPLVFRAEPTRVPCLWAHTAPRPLTCCAVFRQSGAEHTEARCQALFPLSPPRVPLYCPWSILSDRLIPINGIIQKTHPLLCLKPCLQFMSSCSYL